MKKLSTSNVANEDTGDSGGMLRLDASERTELFYKIAGMATDTRLSFWLVLLLSGSIATLGLILDSTAVVIGAMLVAPLLGPLIGVSMALASGDGRLFAQTATTILFSAILVIVCAAAFIATLPIVPVTDEILARARPTLLDLIIAILSGTAAAIVNSARNQHLAGSIPGVAVAVALVPPLAVAGFGLGNGEVEILSGALLLFGANLGGIVLSAFVVFTILGMMRDDVTETARRWHEEGRSKGYSRWFESLRIVKRLPHGDMKMSIILTVVFVLILSVPLKSSFDQAVRDVRLGNAVDVVIAALEEKGGNTIIRHNVTLETDIPVINVTTVGESQIGSEEIKLITNSASAAANEEVEINLR